ncbi:hypothetical protein ACVWZP_002952 [Pseudomonas sp. TE36184]
MSIALNVITGFLGSGKTSLLTRLLQGESLGDTALLINEFGDVGIDHLLVEEVAPDTVLLPGGCVCCSIRGELKDALLSLRRRSSRPSTTTCNCAGVFISAWINSGKRPKPCSGASWTPSTATTRSLGMPLVGASLLAKSPRTPRASRMPASSLMIFASKLAPTGGGGNI